MAVRGAQGFLHGQSCPLVNARATDSLPRLILEGVWGHEGDWEGILVAPMSFSFDFLTVWPWYRGSGEPLQQEPSG